MIDLDDLEELFDDLGNEPTTDQIFQMYGIFLDHFKKNPMVVDGMCLKINENKSKHPLFKGKAETFAHIVTRESKIANRRHFDHQRANRIHWIRPILENKDDSRILYFEKINDQGQNQKYYWYEAGCLLVILRPIEPDVLLITPFAVVYNSTITLL